MKRPSVRIRLTDQGWVQPVPGVWARGSAFREGRLLDAGALAQLFAAAERAEAAAVLASDMTGHFAVVRDGAQGYALVDPSRSYPLFFNERLDSVVVADDPSSALEPGDGAEPMRAALVDFAYCGFVAGTNTLIGSVKQVPAGWIMSWAARADDAPECSLSRYASFTPRLDGWSAPESELHDALFAVMAGAVDDLIAYAAGRTIALPLSAGYDSRVIAMLLASKGYDAVTSFSYGKPGNAEAETSRAIAAELGFPWVFAEFDERSWAQWVTSPTWRAYVDEAHKGVSLPLMQGWASVQVLSQKELIPTEAVFVPGVLGGGVIAGRGTRTDARAHMPADNLRVARRVIDEHYDLWWEQPARTRDLQGVAERIANSLQMMCASGYESDAVAYESYVRQEWTYKFVGNTVRAYQHSGYDWWLPFADRGHTEFWQSVAYEHRLDSALYESFVTRGMPDRLGIPQGSLVRHPKMVKPKRSASYKALRWAFRQSGLKEPYARMRKRLAAATKPKDEVYHSHHLGWWGAVDPEVFAAQYTGLENIYSFMSQELLLSKYGWRRGS